MKEHQKSNDPALITVMITVIVSGIFMVYTALVGIVGLTAINSIDQYESIKVHANTGSICMLVTLFIGIVFVIVICTNSKDEDRFEVMTDWLKIIALFASQEIILLCVVVLLGVPAMQTIQLDDMSIVNVDEKYFVESSNFESFYTTKENVEHATNGKDKFHNRFYVADIQSVEEYQQEH